MPRTHVVFFAEDDGTCPCWIGLMVYRIRTRDKCVVRIRRSLNWVMNCARPEADLLRDGIYELRIRLEA